VDIIEPLLDVPPPNPAKLRFTDLIPLLKVGRNLVKHRRDLPDITSLLFGSARSTLESWFESEPLRATLATDALIGAATGPNTPGTGYVLLHHVMGETDGARGVWAYAEGGMGAISDAIAAAARDAGCEIECNAPVQSIDVTNGVAQGVTLVDGRSIAADFVVSNANACQTLLGMVGAKHLHTDLVAKLQQMDFNSPVVKINLALDALPRFKGIAQNGVAPEHVGTIHIGADNLEALERSYTLAANNKFPERPMIELTIPSTLDASLAPPGQHVASMFVQHVPFDIKPDVWERERDGFADRVFAIVDEMAPGFSASVLHREVLGPPDLERIFGLTGGNIFHGAMTLDKLLFLRPLPELARYQTPVKGLWLCGAGMHPGGGVMGACGRNAAREILRSKK